MTLQTHDMICQNFPALLQDTEVNMTSLGPVLEAAFAAAGMERLKISGADSGQRVGSEGPPEHCDPANYKSADRHARMRRM
jgi:hypothetical protein